MLGSTRDRTLSAWHLFKVRLCEKQSFFLAQEVIMPLFYFLILEDPVFVNISSVLKGARNFGFL